MLHVQRRVIGSWDTIWNLTCHIVAERRVTGHPVRSAIHKPQIGGLVVGVGDDERISAVVCFAFRYPTFRFPLSAFNYIVRYSSGPRAGLNV